MMIGKGNKEEDINDKISIAAKMYNALNKSFIDYKENGKKTKKTIYNTIYRSILTDESESR